MGPEDLAVLLIANDLYEAFCLVRRAGSSVGAEGEPAYLVVQLLFLALILGQPDAGDFRMAIGYAGHIVVADRMGLVAREQLGHEHPLTAPLVGQHGRPGHVADAKDPGRGRLESRKVDLDEP